MTREEAQEYAKTMSYKEAVLNCIHSKGIAYRKASLIKLRELAEIADKLERDNDMTREEAIQWLTNEKWKNANNKYKKEWNEAFDMAIEALQAEPYTDIVPITDKPIGEFDASTGIVTYYGKTRPSDLISRADAIEAVRESCGGTAHSLTDILVNMTVYEKAKAKLQALPSADRPTVDKCDDCLYEDSDKSLFPCNSCKRNNFDKYEKDESNNITESQNIERPIIEHDREWIIGCIKYDGFIKTDRFDKANQIILEALSADAVQGWRNGKPTEQGKYMVTLDSFGHKHIDLFYYGKPMMPNRKVRGKCWYRSDDEWGDVVYDDTDIIAWQPLPKPYDAKMKGGGDE